jgi:hypothetical protein
VIASSQPAASPDACPKNRPCEGRSVGMVGIVQGCAEAIRDSDPPSRGGTRAAVPRLPPPRPSDVHDTSIPRTGRSSVIPRGCRRTVRTAQGTLAKTQPRPLRRCSARRAGSENDLDTTGAAVGAATVRSMVVLPTSWSKVAITPSARWVAASDVRDVAILVDDPCPASIQPSVRSEA